MNFETNYILEDYIIDTKWEDIPHEVRERAIVCSIDLIMALIIGSKGRQFKSGVSLVKSLYKNGNVSIVGLKETFNFAGASIAMAHSANSFDIDDGHNMIKGHPGASIIGGVLAAALYKNISYKEFLTTLVVSYEVAIRSGLAIQNHYNYLHSTGSYGAVGTSAGVSKIFKLNKEELNNALSIADFHAPLTPVMRSVEYPSMNKDGVPFGTLIGVMAVLETMEGVTGKTHLLELEEYRYLLDTLGNDYEVMNLYFKPYTCCRWSHQPIEASLSLMNKHNIKHEEIKKINVYTFESAAKLSKIIPKTTDEAQYNISFPIAAAIIDKDLGFEQVIEENLDRKEVIELMGKINYIVDDEIEEKFPEERLSKVEVVLNSGIKYKSDIFDAPGESKDNVGIDWISDKFRRITKNALTNESQDELLKILTDVDSKSINDIVRHVNEKLFSLK